MDLSKSIFRKRGRSLLLFAVSFVFVCFIAVYFYNIENNRKASEVLGEKLPVTATLMDISGMRQEGLRISQETIDNFQSLDMKDIVLTAESFGNLSYGSQDEKKISVFLAASNDVSAFSGGKKNTTLGEKEFQEMLEGEEPVCLMSRQYMEARKADYQVGDELELNLYEGVYDGMGNADEFQEISTSKVKLIGTFEGKLYEDGVTEPNVICPLGWLQKQYGEAGAELEYTSAKGIVREPQNLNQFKEQAEEMMFLEVNPQSMEDIFKTALSIDDRSFIQTDTKLKRNLAILELFKVPVLVLLTVMEGLIFFLSVHSQKREIFLKRCLGVKKYQIVFAMVGEGSVLAALGSGAAIGLLSCFLHIFSAGMWLEIFVLFLAIQLIGSLVSAVFVSRGNLLLLGTSH